jgi:hypothetical protein
MCGACTPLPRDSRVSGPGDRDAVARAVERSTGLRTRSTVGRWTVSTATGRGHVCGTVESLAETAGRLAGVDPAAVLAVAVQSLERRRSEPVARNGPRGAGSG